jgi:hypothetical protein
MSFGLQATNEMNKKRQVSMSELMAGQVFIYTPFYSGKPIGSTVAGAAYCPEISS